MTPQEAYVALNMVPHIGPVRVRKLLEKFGDPESILAANSKSLQQIEGIGPEAAQAIVDWEKHADLASEFAEIKKAGAYVITQADELYPAHLREIYDPPLVLYVRGTLMDKDRHSISVVGSRDTSHYGLECAKKLSFQLAYNGVTVVSGLARGIDTVAHQGAIAAKGRTIAVIGSGLNHVYPAENQSLAELIVENGAVISEFPMNTKPLPQNFPMRNRIVSGMTMGTLVVEAGQKSGALITARMALDQGKQLFAVPGRIDSPRSRGTHQLIKQGAKLVDEAEDVLAEFEFLFPRSELELVATAQSEKAIPRDLPANEKTLLDLLESEEAHIDELIQKSNLPTPSVSSALLGLELKRLVKQLPGKIFVRLV
ncbi:MAG: DNA-processing protein DprA [Verrucomicrobiota bacterium]|nr:DNA-processing protein DprA [Verrucomicrobiota bacterium]